MRNWRAAIVYYLFFALKKDVAVFPTRVPHPVLNPNECLSLARDIEAAFKRVDLVECLV
jgi:hypothetical protein